MKMMKLSEMNKYMSERGMVRQMNEAGKKKMDKEGFLHNAGIKTRNKLEEIGHELKVNPPKILAKTKRKFGKGKAEKQRKAILLSKARKAGVKIPQSK